MHCILHTSVSQSRAASSSGDRVQTSPTFLHEKLRCSLRLVGQARLHSEVRENAARTIRIVPPAWHRVRWKEATGIQAEGAGVMTPADRRQRARATRYPISLLFSFLNADSLDLSGMNRDGAEKTLRSLSSLQRRLPVCVAVLCCAVTDVRRSNGY